MAQKRYYKEKAIMNRVIEFLIGSMMRLAFPKY